MVSKGILVCGYIIVLTFGNINSMPIVNDTFANEVHVIKQPPIVVKNYEQPSLDEYKECLNNRATCVQACVKCEERERCESDCPLCPELLELGVSLQGYNDSNLKSVGKTAFINTTNIIRLTNEIQNIIQNDIRSSHVNNIHVIQNVTRRGGKYGLGYNERGACCYVVRTNRECEIKNHQFAEGCDIKHHHVCGDLCKARIMYARRVLECKNEETGPCEEYVEYVPRNRYRYIKRHKLSDCSRSCLELPYGYILQLGLPIECYNCLRMIIPITPTLYASPYAMIAQPYVSNDYFFWDKNSKRTEGSALDIHDDFSSDLNTNDWVLETKKCRQPDGTLTEDCTNSYIDGSGDVTQEAVAVHNLDEIDYSVQRRKSFKRSNYSRRHREYFAF